MYVSHSIDICTVAIKNIRNMHAVSTNQIADILHFNDKGNKCRYESTFISCGISPFLYFVAYVAHPLLDQLTNERR